MFAILKNRTPFGPTSWGLNKWVSFAPALTRSLEFGGLRIPYLQIVTLAATVGLVAALALFLKRTRFGAQMRAAAEDFRMARLLGVRANLVIVVAFAVSGVSLALGARYLLHRLHFNPVTLLRGGQ